MEGEYVFLMSALDGGEWPSAWACRVVAGFLLEFRIENETIKHRKG
jgi:hypothetical protein